MGEGYLRQVLRYPLLSGGISDMNASFVLAICELSQVSAEPENVGILLDPDQVYLQERTTALPLTGETTLMVIRITPGTFRTMDILEELLHRYESFMNVAYPFKGVAVLNMDADWPARAFFGDGVMGLSTGFEEDFDLLAHELAHGYWTTPFAWLGSVPLKSGIGLIPFNWIAEGAATFMEIHAADRFRLEHAPTSPSGTDCSLVDTIEEIDRKTFDGSLIGQGLYQSGCNYSMGSGIFADLYNRLGDAEFRRGFRSLYLKMSSLEHDDECTWESRGLCYMRKAFVEDASPGFAEDAGEVIDLWFHGN